MLAVGEQRFPSLFFLFFFLLFFLVLEGCASGQGSDPFSEAINRERFILRVESRNRYDVSVYVNPSGRRELLGTVSANGLEFFEFDYPSGRALFVELQTRLGDRYRVPSMPVLGGGRVDLMVYDDLRRSGFVRRAPE
jgi:hypothetical protein